MKKIICISLLMFLALHNTYAQQDFRFRYNFKKILAKDSIELYRINNKTNQRFKMKLDRKKLVGIIKKTTDITGDLTVVDSLYIRIWPIIDNKDIDREDYVNKNYNYNDFVIAVKKWPTVKMCLCNKTFNAIDLPFKSWQLFAVNIPFRINLKNGSIASDFINANLSVSHIWGNNRIYKTEFVKPRVRYAGLGTYFGFGAIAKGEDKQLGLNYGLNAIGSLYNVNLIGTFGFESGLSKGGGTNPYIGIGFAFDLFSLTGEPVKE